MTSNNLTLKAKCDDLLVSFANNFENHAIKEGHESILSFKNGIGNVELKSEKVDNSLLTYCCDFNFSQDTTLEIVFDKKNALLCMYSLIGEINHIFSEINVPAQCLREFSPEMVLIHKQETIQFSFEKGVEYSFLIIHINEIRYLKERYKLGNYSLKQFREFFNFLNKGTNNLYQGTPNLKIANYVKDLQHLSGDNLSSHLFYKGNINIILSLKIKQFITDNDPCLDKHFSLTKRECMEIKRISEYIKSKPEEPYTVESLCRDTGLSPCLIQEGFKLMHGRTVADFIRNVRLEKAEELISQLDLNISEVVYSVGFTSRSYFAKIFKRKYNCSPKTYQNNKRKVAVTA